LKCSNYNIAENRSNPSLLVANNTNPSGDIDHILLEDNDEFDLFSNTLDLFAHEETWSKKRVKIEDIEDEDDPVKFVSIASSTSNPIISTGNSKSIAAKRLARPRKSKSAKHLQDPSLANKEAA